MDASESRERRAGFRNSTRQTAPGKYTDSDPLDPSISEKFSVKVGLGPEWDQSVIYPETGAKRATVDYRDLQRLDEGEFLNDNLIAFYLRYCEEDYQRLQIHQKPKVYIFSNFFYSALTTTEKGTKGFNYKAVQRWTSKVDIFDFDYIVVPINEDLHWYIAIICNLPNFRKRLKPAESEEQSEEQNEERLDDASRAKLHLHSTAAWEDRGSGAQTPKTVNSNDAQSPDYSSSLADGFRKLSTEGTPTRPETQGIHSDDQAAAAQLQQESTFPRADLALSAQTSDDVSSVQADAREEHQAECAEIFPSEKKSRRKSGPGRTSRLHDPAIVILDSLEIARPATTRYLKQYLQAEGVSRKSMDIQLSDIQGINAKDIPIQRNFCDCGLFLLLYVQQFLKDPRDFTKKIMSREKIEFPDIRPNIMRASIRNLLQDLHKRQKIARDETASKKKPAKEVKKRPTPEGKAGEDSRQTHGGPQPDPQSHNVVHQLFAAMGSWVPSGEGLEGAEIPEKSAVAQGPASLPTSKRASPAKETSLPHLPSSATRKASLTKEIKLPYSPSSASMSASPGKEVKLPHQTPSASRIASPAQVTKPSVSSESQHTKHPPSQFESQDDSVVFIAEHAVPKPVSPLQKRGPNSRSNENGRIEFVPSSGREEEDTRQLPDQTRDSLALLESRLLVSVPKGDKRKFADTQESWEETQHVEQKGVSKKSPIEERHGGHEEVDIVPESPDT